MLRLIYQRTIWHDPRDHPLRYGYDTISVDRAEQIRK